MFKKILIANRGEVAMRIMRTCKEMGIKTVAVFSTADRKSLHVSFADEAVCIGPPASVDSYLSIPRIMSAAEITNADAIHPGWGFLAENASLAEICKEYQVKFIGPTADMIRKMGDKITAKETMIKAKVPVIPGSKGLIKNIAESKKEAKKIGYPVILKATAGGGGKGMRIVHNESDFEENFNLASNEAKASFGNEGIYLEKFIEEPRHIEFQIAGDQYGNICHLSERDCTIQRRHQKLVEESPSPFVDEDLRKKMGDAAIKAAKSIKYESVGTIEFLLDKYGKFYFMEMNTRLQVEHTITEEVISYDLVKEQIKIAAGVPVTGTAYLPQRYAIECRINAEDPYNNFMPSPGTITELHTPKGHGVRVDTHIYSGYTVPPHYDSLLAKLITIAQTREEAIATMERSLEEFILEGVKTTLPFHRALMKNEQFRSGKYSTSFLDDFVMPEPDIEDL